MPTRMTTMVKTTAPEPTKILYLAADDAVVPAVVAADVAVAVLAAAVAAAVAAASDQELGA